MDIKTMSKKAIREWDINSVLKRLETKRKKKIIITFDKNGKARRKNKWTL